MVDGLLLREINFNRTPRKAPGRGAEAARINKRKRVYE
jgi:hypothetical protein